jgi:hypothetical protein
MKYFPCLASGAMCQYPLAKTRSFRTIRTEAADGSEVKLEDVAPQRVSWELQYENLSRPEWTAISEFFQNREGRLGTFVFLDPFDNLVRYSENFTADAWLKDPGLQLTADVNDPNGGSAATLIRNVSPAGQRITQSITMPSGAMACLSVSIRSEAGAVIDLVRESNGAEERRSFPSNAKWTRICFAGRTAADSERATFGIELPAGVQVELFGAQVEGQPGASGYKKTIGQSGVYECARFDDDSLTVRIEDQDRYSTKLHVCANRQE